jgi:hypothetical protein
MRTGGFLLTMGLSGIALGAAGSLALPSQIKPPAEPEWRHVAVRDASTAAAPASWNYGAPIDLSPGSSMIQPAAYVMERRSARSSVDEAAEDPTIADDGVEPAHAVLMNAPGDPSPLVGRGNGAANGDDDAARSASAPAGMDRISSAADPDAAAETPMDAEPTN